MSTTTSGTGRAFGRLVDELVAGARADRDGVFNTLDAINRRTHSVSDRLAEEVEQFLTVTRPQSKPASVDERDSRFDPEDEWELPPATERESQNVQPSGGIASSTANDDDDDVPQTWLR